MMMLRNRFLLNSLVLAVILVAAWLRFCNLADVPPSMWFDEAYNALEAVNTWKTGYFPIFFSGNNGREPLLLYLLAVAVPVFGAFPYSIRFVTAIIGILTVPLLFRCTYFLFRAHPLRYWIALGAAGGLATSFWHVGISRLGLRAILFPPFLIISVYFFVRALQTQRLRYFLAAGLALGLSQYTYLAARLLPFVFVLFGLVWLWWGRDRQPAAGFVWRGLAAMGLVAAVVFFPLGLYFWLHPGTFSARLEDIALSQKQITIWDGLQQATNALRLFWDAGGTRWRYALPTHPLLDWVSLIGFWLGVALLLARHSSVVPASILVGGLLVMWLPGLLSREPVHELRQVGVLPFVYIISALGYVGLAKILARRLQPPAKIRLIGVMATVPLLVISGAITTYNYFWDWATHPQVYAESRGEIVDIAQRSLELADNGLVILPFETYAYPSARYILGRQFSETVFDPVVVARYLEQAQQVILISPKTDFPPSHGLVWLIRDQAGGTGTAYISHLLPQFPLADSPGSPATIKNALGMDVGRQYWLKAANIKSILAGVGPTRLVNYSFDNQLQLMGFNLTPSLIRPGQFSALDLYWLGKNTGELSGDDVFVQLTAINGDPVGQFHEATFSSTVSRWHWNALIPGRHLIWTGPDIAPGVYAIQLGLFEPATLVRAQITKPNGEALGSQVTVGLLYVSSNDTDPRQPQNRLDIELENGVTLLGYEALPAKQSSMWLRLYWQTQNRLNQNYIRKIQLSDAAGRQNVDYASEPLNGLYPTSFWQPGEVILDQVEISLPPNFQPGQHQFKISLIDPVSNVELQIVNNPLQFDGVIR